MALEFNYQPKLPHSLKWATGYELGMSCKDYYKLWFQKKSPGPKNGKKINLRNLPFSPKEKNFVRFWAAKPKDCGGTWGDFNKAYNEVDKETEMEPPIDYFNGGMVPIVCGGKVSFRILLPAGYLSKNGYIHPHFHYRVCQGGKMGPVHTVSIRSDNCPSKSCNLLVMSNNNQSVERNLSHFGQRLYPDKGFKNKANESVFKKTCSTLWEDQ